MRNDLTGRWGEETAAAYLRRRHYTIVAANYRCRLGEIDLIAENRDYLVFVEVKRRKNDAYAEAKEFVTAAKQQRVMRAAQLWLQQNETELQPRFDVIEIYAPNGEKGRVRINHIEHAF